MEEVGRMNIFTALFGIFRQRGLVTAIRENRSMSSFTFWAILFSVCGGMLYGLAMGIGITPETALKDGIKVALLVFLGFFLSVPFFLLAYRLMGREESAEKVMIIPLTLVMSVTLILAVTAPLVFLLSLLAGFTREAVYLHIVIVDVALLVGFYLSGTLVFNAFPEDRNRLVVPNVAGFLMMLVVLVVLILFFKPYLESTSSFSSGTDILKDRLGIGVSDKVMHAFNTAASAERLSYRFQQTNDNGDLSRDCTVHRSGEDYYLEVHLYNVPGSPVLSERHLWLLGKNAFHDFEGNAVIQGTPGEMNSRFMALLPHALFTPPAEWGRERWRAFEKGGILHVTCLTSGRRRLEVNLESPSLRLKGWTSADAGPGIGGEKRVQEVSPGLFDRGAMEEELDMAVLRSRIDRSDASLEASLQDRAFFAVLYPRTWHSGSWDSARRLIKFYEDEPDGPSLEVRVYDPDREGAKYDVGAQARRLQLQPAFREVVFRAGKMNGCSYGRLDYLMDRTVKGRIETSRHREYVFSGKRGRFHLDLAAPSGNFDSYGALFESLASHFRFI
jgi:hypothetical protein